MLRSVDSARQHCSGWLAQRWKTEDRQSARLCGNDREWLASRSQNGDCSLGYWGSAGKETHVWPSLRCSFVRLLSPSTTQTSRHKLVDEKYSSSPFLCLSLCLSFQVSPFLPRSLLHVKAGSFIVVLCGWAYANVNTSVAV